jgi:hypothetical protein
LGKLITAEREARLRVALARIPEHCREGLSMYLLYGVPPGSFLRAVLSNDLSEACARADEENQRALYDYVYVLYNVAPANAWGSPTKVDDWIKAAQEARAASTAS